MKYKKCPKCGRENIKVKINDIKIIHYFLGTCLPVFIKGYECKECKHKWNK